MSYQIRFSTEPADIQLAQIFRGRLFRGGAMDLDDLDDIAVHGLITLTESLGDEQLVCTFRMMAMDSADAMDRSYSAQFYNLDELKKNHGKSLELGRFCVDPAHSHPDVIRMAWSALTQYVLDRDIDLLFGCSSFHGSDIEQHAEALALLKERHLAPRGLMPRIKAPKVFEFAKKFRLRKPNMQLANKTMPPLLRSYLMMGGWVSDHAVVDHDLNTVHVFTGVELKSIPPARRKLFAGLLGRG